MYQYVGLKDKVEMETRWWLSGLPIVKTTSQAYRSVLPIVYGFPSESYKLN